MQFNSTQIKSISKLLLDLGKFFFGSVVVGFFIPKAGIPAPVFILGIIFSLGLFIIGIKLLNSL